MLQSNAAAWLPPDLLEAISTPSGGRVVLVIGAGCSSEHPTSLPLAGDLSKECHRKLVADRILPRGEVDDKSDLSAVAEAVVRRTGCQRDLVDRFPAAEFRNAKPNEGYLIMAALLLEGALADALTLNFDHAAQNALADLGAGAQVETIRGPDEHRQLGGRNLIYLHRDIDSSPNELILRTEELEAAWRAGWEEVITQRVLAGPFTVFVGLGTPAAVLIDTTKRILEAIGSSNARAYVVDPAARGQSRFADALEINSKDYIRMGWGEFMRALGHRLIEEQLAAVERTCVAQTQELGLDSEDVTDLCSRLAEIGLPGLGQVRAEWMLDSAPYLPHQSGPTLRLFSDLVLAIRMVERTSGWQADFGTDGIVEFCKDQQVARVMVCHGSGLMSTTVIDAKLRDRREHTRRQGRGPSFALVAGAIQRPDIAPPTDIVAGTDPDDLVVGPEHFEAVSVSDLRDDPSLVHKWIR